MLGFMADNYNDHGQYRPKLSVLEYNVRCGG